jgi:hypothetical protein
MLIVPTVSRALLIGPSLVLLAIACSRSRASDAQTNGSSGAANAGARAVEPAAHPLTGSAGTPTGGTASGSAGTTSAGTSTATGGTSMASGGASTVSGGGSSATGGTSMATGGASTASAGTATGGGSGDKRSYATDFDLTESPISEQGAWTRRGLDWTQVNSASGRAFGTHSGSAYNDSYAHLSGFTPDVEVTTVIYLDGSIGSSYHEVEILLRWSDSAHDAHGYECNLNYAGGYAEIVRWNGAIGDFTYVGGGQGAGGGHKPVNGSVFKARIQGNIITTSLDGVVLQTADISAVSGPVWADGDPGMGFYNGESGKYGFQSYSAVSL